MQADYKQELLSIRAQEEAVVLVTGVFDVLHQEHKTFLEKAKKYGFLVVALESDRRVKELKGDDRPINSLSTRIKNIEALNIANKVIALPEEFGEMSVRKEFMISLHPNYLAVSSHTNHIKKKHQMMQQLGGELVVVHKYNPAFSSSKLISTARKVSDG